MEIGNLPEKEFRIMIVKIPDLKKRMEKRQEMFLKDLDELKNKERLNNTLEGIHSRISDAEEWISDLKERMVYISASEQNIEKKNEKK